MPTHIPSQYSEVVIYNADTNAKVFRGIVDSITIDQKSGDLQIWKVSCSGLEYLLDNAIINRTWTGQTDRQIIQDAFGSVLPEISTTNATVAQLLVATDFQAKDITLRHLLDQLCQLSGGEYRITEDKELSYRAAGSVIAPFGFSDRPNV